MTIEAPEFHPAVPMADDREFYATDLRKAKVGQLALVELPGRPRRAAVAIITRVTAGGQITARAILPNCAQHIDIRFRAPTCASRTTKFGERIDRYHGNNTTLCWMERETHARLIQEEWRAFDATHGAGRIRAIMDNAALVERIPYPVLAEAARLLDAALSEAESRAR